MAPALFDGKRSLRGKNVPIQPIVPNFARKILTTPLVPMSVYHSPSAVPSSLRFKVTRPSRGNKLAEPMRLENPELSFVT